MKFKWRNHFRRQATVFICHQARRRCSFRGHVTPNWYLEGTGLNPVEVRIIFQASLLHLLKLQRTCDDCIFSQLNFTRRSSYDLLYENCVRYAWSPVDCSWGDFSYVIHRFVLSCTDYFCWRNNHEIHWRTLDEEPQNYIYLNLSWSQTLRLNKGECHV